MNEEDIRATLAKSPLLSDLDPTALMFLVRLGKRRTFRPGETLMKQGEPSTSIHFVLEGQCKVERQRRSDDRAIELARLGSGEIIGEMGVMVDLPRSATVVATQPTTTLELDAASFDRAARAFPILHRVLAKLLSERLRRTSERVSDTGRG